MNSFGEVFESDDQSIHDHATPSQVNQVNAVSHAGHACRHGLELGGGAGPRPRYLHAVDGPAQVIDRSEDSYVGSWTQVHSDSLLTAWGVRKKKRTVKFEDEVPAVMPREVNSVNACEGTWEKIDITVDSGAVDTVAPPSVASHVPIESTWASQEGYCYRAANGQLLPNLGEKDQRSHARGMCCGSYLSSSGSHESTGICVQVV